MEKTIDAADAGRRLGAVLDAVVAQGERYVVEQNGTPVAAVVPIEIYERWKRARDTFFKEMREVRTRANLNPEEGEALVAEAIAAVRAEGHARRR